MPRLYAALLALVSFSACGGPPGARPPLNPERTAIDAVSRAWIESGRDPRAVRCAEVRGLRITTLRSPAFEAACSACPVRDQTCDSERFGGRSAGSCLVIARRTIVLADEGDPRARLHRVAHEAAHMIRGCAWLAARESGEPPAPPVRLGVPEDEYGLMRRAVDDGHRDRDLWRMHGTATIEGAAQATIDAELNPAIGRTDDDPLVEAPDGRGPDGEPYLASGWVDGVGRYAWGHTAEEARSRWLERWRDR